MCHVFFFLFSKGRARLWNSIGLYHMKTGKGSGLYHFGKPDYKNHGPVQDRTTKETRGLRLYTELQVANSEE